MSTSFTHYFQPNHEPYVQFDRLSGEVGNVGRDDLLHLLLDLLGEDTTAELLEQTLVLRLELLSAESVSKRSITELKFHSQRSLPSGNLVDGDLVKHTVDTGVDKRSHDLGGHGGVLGLLEQLGETGTSVQEVSGGGVTGYELKNMSRL